MPTLSDGFTTPGAFILVDGIRGAGKSTLARFLSRSIDKAVYSHEPYGFDPYSRAFREKGELERLLLFLADRVGHQAQLLQWTRLGLNAIVDRYTPSTDCYNIALLPFGEVAAAGEAVGFVDSRLQPDLYLWLDVDPEEAATRVARRAGEEMKVPDLLPIFIAANQYEQWWKHNPRRYPLLRRIDANQEQEQVEREALDAVRLFMEERRIVLDTVAKP